MAHQEASLIAVPDGRTVTALWAGPDTSSRPGWLFAYAPGAGSNVHDPFGRFVSQELAGIGIGSVRFQFPYMEAHRRTPDRQAVLEATWRAVIGAARERSTRLAVGGRSMGGRIASQVVVQGALVDALVLFAYPLHPPGKPAQLRDSHLPHLTVPTFFCSGNNDAFGSAEELRAAASKVARSHLHLLEGADHSFSVPKSSGRSRAEIWEEAVKALERWLGLIDA